VGFLLPEMSSDWERIMSEQQRQSRFERSDELVVMKFGGTSVEDTAAIRRLIGIVKSRSDGQRVIVVSALARVTDQLLEAGKAAAAGHLGAALATVRDIHVRHDQLADELVEGVQRGILDYELRGEFRPLESLLHDLEASRQSDLIAQDLLLGYGERISSKLITAAVSQAGIDAAHVDARQCIVTDARHGWANPVWDATDSRVQNALIPLLEAGRVPVLGGFIASTADGVATSLGRNGSDLSAAIIAAALCASRVEIWKDVDGVMTADPKLCADARVIRKMSFDEAAALAAFGAKVLHPAALAPAMRENIPVHVLNARRPESEGTQIVARAKSGDAVSAIVAKSDIATVEVESHPGVDSDLFHAVFAAFDRHACPVDVMAASRGRMSLLVGSIAALPAISADLQSVADVRWENHQALVSLVGKNIRRQPEIASLIFAAVSDMDVRVVCQGASDQTVSFLVEESKVEESVRRLHRVFFSPQEPFRDWGGISSAYCQAG
jgi:aspartate kinase